MQGVLGIGWSLQQAAVAKQFQEQMDAGMLTGCAGQPLASERLLLVSLHHVNDMGPALAVSLWSHAAACTCWQCAHMTAAAVPAMPPTCLLFVCFLPVDMQGILTERAGARTLSVTTELLGGDSTRITIPCLALQELLAGDHERIVGPCTPFPTAPAWPCGSCWQRPLRAPSQRTCTCTGPELFPACPPAGAACGGP